MSLFEFLGASSGPSTTRSPFATLSHALVVLKEFILFSLRKGAAALIGHVKERRGCHGARGSTPEYKVLGEPDGALP